MKYVAALAAISFVVVSVWYFGFKVWDRGEDPADYRARHGLARSLYIEDGKWFSEQRRKSHVPMVPFNVKIHYGVQRRSMDETQGWTYEGAKGIWIGKDVWHEPSVFYHEMGHLYDYGMDRRTRDRFYDLMGEPRSRGWWVRFYSDSNASLGEWFADYYASCAEYWYRTPYIIKGTNFPWVEGYKKTPVSQEVYEEVCDTIKESTWTVR